MSQDEQQIDDSEAKQQIPKPSEYMRSNRPYLFSDTVEVVESVLERSHLEYHLDTLTSRKQEFIFEEFCRQLAEVELCPNLKPQTGPLGGGDSKTDSSTYPVAEVLVERCYWGTPKPPTSEAWAFAFSCAKQWRPKARADVAKIAKLQQRFSTVYVISNQFIKDKSRSGLERELSAEFGFAVHILDRTWILNVIFSHRREDLAIDALNIEVSRQPQKQAGPQDSDRRAQLDSLLLKLRAPLEHFGNDYSIAAAYLRAAKLARALELPRHEMAGLFLQARQIAVRNGHLPQIVRCAYEHAWADNWWHDDASTAIAVYSEIEPLLSSIRDASDVEMFANLQSLMWQAVYREEASATDLKLVEREHTLRGHLELLVHDTMRPNNSLYAETMVAFLDLSPWNPETREAGLGHLRECFEKSRGLTTYPLKRFTDTVVGISDALEAIPGYDQLFETMRNVLSERDGEIADAPLILQRGEQHLRADRAVEALKVLETARVKAAKEEILELSVRAANLAAAAYLKLGLVWAARIQAIAAAQLSCQWVDGVFQSAWHGSRATRLLAWVDLSQGRLGPFLRWMGIASVCNEQLAQDDFDISQFQGAYQTMETALCERLISLDEQTALRLMPIANTLHLYGFQMARFVLFYAAGRGDQIADEFTSAMEVDVQGMRAFLGGWKHRVDAASRNVVLVNGWQGEAARFSTKIMEVQFVVESFPSFGAIAFSENLLGVIEAMAAHADRKDLTLGVNEVKIKIDVQSGGKNPPDITFSSAGGQHGLELVWEESVGDWLALTARDEVAKFLLRACLATFLVAKGDSSRDANAEIDRLFSEGSFHRALGVSPTIHAVADLIGKDGYELERCIAAAAS